MTLIDRTDVWIALFKAASPLTASRLSQLTGVALPETFQALSQLHAEGRAVLVRRSKPRLWWLAVNGPTSRVAMREGSLAREAGGDEGSTPKAQEPGPQDAPNRS